MIDFDVRTALLMVGLLYFLLPIITWIVLAKQRSQAVALWCIGGLLMGVTAFLTGAQQEMPTWLYMLISPLTFHGASLIRIQALRLDLGIPWKTRWIVLATFGLMLIVNVIQYVLDDTVLRAQVTSFAAAALLFYLATLAWRIGRDEQSNNAKWIAWMYFLASLTLLYRVVILIGHTGDVGVPVEGFSSRILSLAMLFAAVVGHLGYIGLHLDRSMRREIKTAADRARDEESRRLGEQIAQLDRQRSLGEMSASLGHELNQPLTAILTNAQVAKRGLLAGRFQAEQFGEFLDKIIQNTQRASQIIERIRGFIRPTVARCEPVDLNRTVHEVADLIAAEARSHQVKLVFAKPAAPVLVAGDSIQISQIILNVLRNAIEALQQVAHREIRIASTRADGRVILQIRDSGPGLAAEALAQVGSPFFTTKPSGLGMGISISRSIAQQHGGTLSIANADQGGAVVELNLPALPEGSS
jgi:signal transduction histidine kinase